MDQVKKLFIDQMGRKVEVDVPPRRIVSLVPSQTELLYALGLGEQVVGLTNFCVHPGSAREEKTRIGGTKKFKFDRIEALQPELIIGNKEENYLEGIAELEEKYPVWMSDIVTLQDAFDMMQKIGELTAKEVQAAQLIAEIKSSLEKVQPAKKLKALYLIWRKPYMAVAAGTFIHEMLPYAGFENVLKKDSRYPELTEEQIKALDPEVVLLSSEPFPFKDKHVEEFQQLLPNAKIIIVDGEMFSWYGSRLSFATDYFEKLRCELDQ